MDKKKTENVQMEEKTEEKSEDDQTEEKVEEKEAEGPTEKDLFEMQIDQLKRQLEDADRKLQQRKETLAEVRGRLEKELDSEQACVSYLKRVLQFETDRRLEVQEKLETLRDQAELMERRALGKFAATEQSKEAAQSQFLLEKLELEGKLSLLEELRLKRDSQMAHLKEVEEALNEKMSTLRQKSREVDIRKVAALMKSREQFLEKCREMRREWQEAFRLRMPGHAKKQLEENVRLRQECDRATEKLLQVQDQNRNLKILQKSLELEEEIQTSAEEDTRKRKILQEKHLKQLLLAQQELQPDGGQKSLQNLSKNDSHFPKKSTDEKIAQQDIRLEDASTSDNTVKQQSEMDECTLEQDIRLQKIFAHDDTLKRNTEIDKVIPKEDIVLQDESALEDTITQKTESNNCISQQSSRLQHESMPKSAVKQENQTADTDRILQRVNRMQDLLIFEHAVDQRTETVDRFLEKNNMLQGYIVPQDEVKQNTEIDKRIHELDNKLQNVSKLEEVFKWKTETDKRIPEQVSRVQGVLKPKGTQKWKTERDEEIIELGNKLQVLSLPEGLLNRNAETGERIVVQSSRMQQTSPPEGVVKRKIETIAVGEAEKCRLLDRCEEAMVILRDQVTYKKSLEEELEQNTDWNGALMSTLLRAGKIFEVRCSKLRDERQNDMDFDLLQQIRFLFNMTSSDTL